MSHLLFFNLVLLYLAFKSKHSARHICFLGQAASNTSCMYYKYFRMEKLEYKEQGFSDIMSILLEVACPSAA